MGLSLQEDIRNFIRSLPNVQLKHDPMSEEAYFYGMINIAHFHAPQHVGIRLSKPQQEQALRKHMAFPPLCSASGMGIMRSKDY